MTLQGHVKDGLIVLDQPVALPEGAQVRVEVLQATAQSSDTTVAGQTLGQKFMQYAGKAKGLPSDLARHHDHYIHGTPRE